MLEQLKRWLRPPTSQTAEPSPNYQTTFRQALAAYPAHVPPHKGYGHQITPEQAQQNLDWFRGSLPERLASLRALLANTGLPLQDEDLSPDSLDTALDLVRRLIEWTRACWPSAPYQAEHKSYDHWAMSARNGDDAIFSVVLDMATLMGQWVMAGRPEWRWGLDMSRASLGHQPMLTARRVVLTTPLLGTQRVPCMMDMEMLVLGRYREPASPYFKGAQDLWIEYMRDGYTGREIDLLNGKVDQ